MEKKSYIDCGGTQVVDELALRCRMKELGRLEFDGEALFNQQVQSIMTNWNALEHDGNWEFKPHLQSAQPKLMGQCISIDCLKEAVAERVIDLVERRDDLAAHLVLSEAGPSTPRIRQVCISHPAYSAIHAFEGVTKTTQSGC